MLIIRSRGTAQEVRRLASDLQRVIGWSNSGVTGKNTCGLPVGAVHPNRPRECNHVMKQAIEVNRPYLRDQKFATARAAVTRSPRRPLAKTGADQTLLPLHLSFCRTTLKNEASGNDASGSVFFALRMVTIDPRCTWLGLRPSSVRYTG